MSKKLVNISLDNVYQLIRQNIYSCVTNPIEITDKKFHHRLNIKSLPIVLQHGLLSNKLKAKIIEKRNLTEKEKFVFSDECHVNGYDYVSVSSVEEDLSKMYKDEDLWDTYLGIDPDIIISSRIDAKKNTINYFNEYIVQDKIPVEMFNSIDMKLLKIMDYNFFNKEQNKKEEKIKMMLEYYNYLREVAIILKQNNLNIPLRETSEVANENEYDKALTLDCQKVIQLPKITLK